MTAVFLRGLATNNRKACPFRVIYGTVEVEALMRLRVWLEVRLNGLEHADFLQRPIWLTLP